MEITKTHTSLNLSKKLKDNGCDIESEMYWLSSFHNRKWRIVDKYDDDFNGSHDSFPVYDLLWDIALNKSKEFFGEEMIYEVGLDSKDKAYLVHGETIFSMIQYDEPVEKIEEYILEYTIFNPNNK